MGLDILTERLQEIRRNQPAANQVGWLLNLANIVCLDEFLKLLAVNLGVVAQFKALLNGLIITAGESVSVLNVIIAELETANNLVATILGTFDAAKNAALGKLNLFPFNDSNYLQCPPVQAIKNFLTSQLPQPDPTSLLPGNAQRFAKKYKQAAQSFKELKYRVYRNGKNIAALKKKVGQIQTQILAWQAIVDAIGVQFGV